MLCSRRRAPKGYADDIANERCKKCSIKQTWAGSNTRCNSGSASSTHPRRAGLQISSARSRTGTLRGALRRAWQGMQRGHPPSLCWPTGHATSVAATLADETPPCCPALTRIEQEVASLHHARHLIFALDDQAQPLLEQLQAQGCMVWARSRLARQQCREGTWGGLGQVGKANPRVIMSGRQWCLPRTSANL